MFKKILCVALAAALSLSFAGCNMVFTDEAKDMAQVVAKVGDATLTKAEAQDQITTAMNVYGVTSDYLATDQGKELLESYKTSVVDAFVKEQLVNIKAKEYGLDKITTAQEATIAKDIADTKEYIKKTAASNAAGTVASDSTKNLEEETSSQEASLSESYGITDGSLEKSKREEIVENNLKEYLTKDYKPTDAEAKTWYDTNLKTQKESIESSPTSFLSYAYNGLGLYAPEGYRYLKDVMIKIDDTKYQEIKTLRDKADAASKSATSASSPSETTAAETTATTPAEVYVKEAAEYNAQADALRDKYLAEIKDKADKMLTRTKTEDFDSLLSESDDTHMQLDTYTKYGYCVYDGTAVYDEAVVKAVMDLKNVGDKSDLVATEKGYYIVEYSKAITPGTQSFDSTKEAIKTELISQKQDDTLDAKITDWKKELKVETHMDVLDDLFTTSTN